MEGGARRDEIVHDQNPSAAKETRIGDSESRRYAAPALLPIQMSLRFRVDDPDGFIRSDFHLDFFGETSRQTFALVEASPPLAGAVHRDRKNGLHFPQLFPVRNDLQPFPNQQLAEFGSAVVLKQMYQPSHAIVENPPDPEVVEYAA